MIDLPRLRNSTRGAAALVPTITGSGWTLVCVVKQRFDVTSDGATPVTGASVRFADEPWDPANPSAGTKWPSDIVPPKPGTDVLVVGDAIAPGGRTVSTLDVHVGAGAIACSLRVCGPRVWYDRGDAIAVTDPTPFTRLALRWDKAYGGKDETDPAAIVEEPRNPFGIGVARDPRRLVGQMAPQIESPSEPLVSHKTQPAPVGVAPIGSQFEPRRSYSGTHDEAWRRDRMPLPPLDFDERFHQQAPPAMCSVRPLRGGEAVQISGMHASGAIAFELPRLSFLVESAASESRLVFDTLLVEPNELRFEMTWRAQVPWPRASGRRAEVFVRTVPS